MVLQNPATGVRMDGIMKPLNVHSPIAVLLLTASALWLAAGTSGAAEPASREPEYRAGKSLIPTRVFTAEDDQKILKAFDGLRVADVTDGMDFVGLKNIGLMDPEIHPVWKGFKDYRHRFIGIAVTVRYVPTQRPPPSAASSRFA